MTHPKLGQLSPIVPNYNPYESRTVTRETPEAKIIRELATQIKQIESETEYIKEYDEVPPQTPDYYKRLNII